MLLAPLLLGARCGPSDSEAGAAVLVASPLVVGLGMLVSWGLFAIWRTKDRQLVWFKLPTYVGLGACAVLAGLAMGVEGEIREWVGMAIIIYGCSYLSLLLVVWRIWFAIDRRSAFAWAWLPVTCYQLVPAALAAFADADAEAWFTLAWVLPGYFGVSTAPLLLVFFLEATFRKE